MIIGSIDFGAVVDALHPAQQRLSREINPKVLSQREWKSKVREKNPFVSDVLSKKKIFLLGNERDHSGNHVFKTNAVMPARGGIRG